MILPVWKCELKEEGAPIYHSYNASAKKETNWITPGNVYTGSIVVLLFSDCCIYRNILKWWLR